MGEEEPETQNITGQKRAWEPGGPPEGPPPDAEAEAPPAASAMEEEPSDEAPPAAPPAPPEAAAPAPAPTNGALSAEEQALQGEAAWLRQTNSQLQSQLAQLQAQHAQLTQQQRAAAAQAHHAAAAHHHMMVQQPPPAARPAHNPQWTEQVNPENGTTYYWNSVTGESTYTRPADYNPGAAGAAAAPAGPQTKGPPGANLFVVRKMRRGEYDEFNDNDLRAEFGKFGTVTRAEMTIDKETGWSKGFGFVSFATVPEADAAVAAVHGAWMAGREMKVEKTRED